MTGNCIGYPLAWRLSLACFPIEEAFGSTVYLVGSAADTSTPEYRDVDLRVLLPDDRFEALIGEWPTGFNAFHHLLCTGISLYLKEATGLPIDFQIQKQSFANEHYPKEERIPIGHLRDSRGVDGEYYPAWRKDKEEK